jgi:hypothetical protein
VTKKLVVSQQGSEDSKVDDSAVEELNDTTLYSFIMDPANDVLVMFYAPCE